MGRGTQECRIAGCGLCACLDHVSAAWSQTSKVSSGKGAWQSGVGPCRAGRTPPTELKHLFCPPSAIGHDYHQPASQSESRNMRSPPFNVTFWAITTPPFLPHRGRSYTTPELDVSRIGLQRIMALIPGFKHGKDGGESLLVPYCGWPNWG